VAQALNILVVDDEQPIREVMKEFLERRHSYRVLTAEDGFEALQILSKEKIDCCLTDISMPGLDGLELTGRIQSLDNTIPVVVMTGYPSLESAIRTLKNGVVDFLIKPVRLDQLSMVIERTMRERSLFVENVLLKEEVKGKQRILDLNRELEEKIRELETVNLILRRLDHPASSRALFETLVNLCGEITSCNEAHFVILDQEKKEPSVISSFYEGVREGTRENDPVRQDLLDRMATEGLPVLVKGEDGKGILIAAPLKIRSSLFGALVLRATNGKGPLKEKDLYYLDFLLDKASSSIENFALYDNLYQSLFSILYAFVETLEARDAYTKQHSARVTRYAVAMAKVLDRTEEEIEILQVAANLHDIGKIGVPDHILLKPGKLTAEEYEVIKKHPLIGSHIIGHFDMWSKEQCVVRAHHERWDGRGYPDGLKKEQIPYLARIISIADVYDALTSDRSYRSKMSQDKALAILSESAGSQFDPEISKVFIDLLHQRTMDLNHGPPETGFGPDAPGEAVSAP
jgi:response regulator RpfG family c-di-GMP phosphodiesterase